MIGQKSARWFWLAFLVVVADRATKFAVETYTPRNFHRIVIPGLVTLVHSRNPGIAFGLLADAGSRWVATILIGCAALAVALLAWLLATNRAGGRPGRVGMALILGGATGNLIDRVTQGGVTDFFEVGLGSYRWPAFNVADSAITIGALLVVFELLFLRRHPTKERA
ncbi:MAG TPA: signal peptidase II [Candidatus Acidoferrales bacterium]|nr:signal peptidase II [Candidatus Acidoferrales bacterium]